MRPDCALGDPALISQAVATVLGVRESGPTTIRDFMSHVDTPKVSAAAGLAAFLRPRHALLLLDNCEYLIAPCAALAEMLLRTCHRL